MSAAVKPLRRDVEMALPTADPTLFTTTYQPTMYQPTMIQHYDLIAPGGNQQGVASRAGHHRNRNLDYFSLGPHIKRVMDGNDGEWEFVDFERVFSKTPGLGGVLENCEIAFRSVPGSPVPQGVSKVNDNPFDYASKNASRQSSVPGTPVLTTTLTALSNVDDDYTTRKGVSKLNEEFITKKEQDVQQSSDTKSGPDLPVAPQRRSTIAGGELEIIKRKAETFSRTRKDSASSTDDETRKHNKLMKNRQSARECRRRKKEYIGKLELQLKQTTHDNTTMVQQLKERDELISVMLAELKKTNPRWVIPTFGIKGVSYGKQATTSNIISKRKKKGQSSPSSSGDAKRART